MGPVRPAISSLRPGQEVAGVFACTRKERRVARTGTPYLALELRDRTGSLSARAFRDADVLAGRFDRGDLVRVRGRVERWRDALTLELADVARVPPGEADPAAFLPAAYRDLGELEGFLEHLAGEVHGATYPPLLAALLGDGELRAAWHRAPCTLPGAGAPGSPAHHAYLGGLLEHTVAVAQLAVEACSLHPRLDSDLLVCAALVHDLGHTREFTYGTELALTEEGRLLGHVELGVGLLREHGAPPELLHCVLTHHGPQAAPGGRFASAEAVALHRLAALDRAVKGALEHGLG